MCSIRRFDLTNIGIGIILGAGVFVTTGTVANGYAGWAPDGCCTTPSVCCGASTCQMLIACVHPNAVKQITC